MSFLHRQVFYLLWSKLMFYFIIICSIAFFITIWIESFSFIPYITTVFFIRALLHIIYFVLFMNTIQFKNVGYNNITKFREALLFYNKNHRGLFWTENSLLLSLFQETKDIVSSHIHILIVKNRIWIESIFHIILIRNYVIIIKNWLISVRSFCSRNLCLLRLFLFFSFLLFLDIDLISFLILLLLLSSITIDKFI